MKCYETKILIVEDEPLVSDGMRAILDGMGVFVTGVARSAQEAIAAIEADRPHLILLDLSLSGQLEGVDLARQVQQRWRIPVLFISGHLGDHAIGTLDDIDTAGYVVKPFYPVNLREAVASAIDGLPH